MAVFQEAELEYRKFRYRAYDLNESRLRNKSYHWCLFVCLILEEAAEGGHLGKSFSLRSSSIQPSVV